MQESSFGVFQKYHQVLVFSWRHFWRLSCLVSQMLYNNGPERSQKIFIKSEDKKFNSESKQMIIGVPQGSGFGPIFFVIHTNEFPFHPLLTPPRL